MRNVHQISATRFSMWYTFKRKNDKGTIGQILTMLSYLSSTYSVRYSLCITVLYIN